MTKKIPGKKSICVSEKNCVKNVQEHKTQMSSERSQMPADLVTGRKLPLAEPV